MSHFPARSQEEGVSGVYLISCYTPKHIPYCITRPFPVYAKQNSPGISLLICWTTPFYIRWFWLPLSWEIKEALVVRGVWGVLWWRCHCITLWAMFPESLSVDRIKRKIAGCWLRWVIEIKREWKIPLSSCNVVWNPTMWLSSENLI